MNKSIMILKHSAFVAIVLVSCNTQEAPPADVSDATPAKVTAPITTASGLFESKDLGTVAGTDGHTYIIRSGRYCDECDTETSLYIFDSAQGEPNIAEGVGARMHPGIARDGDTGEPYYEARTFFGEVLEGVPGVIWYERAMEPDGSMQEHTVLVDLTEGMQEQQQAGHVLLERTLALAAAGKCTEIAGVDRTSAP